MPVLIPMFAAIGTSLGAAGATAGMTAAAASAATASAAALGAGVTGAAISGIGAITGGIAQSNAASYNAQVAANNAKISQQNANSAAQAGEVQSTNQGLKEAGIAGQIKAAQAANGVDVNSGSAVNVQKSQAIEGQQDTENVLNNALLQAYGYRAQATSYESQSALDKQEAAQAPIAGTIGAVGSLLSSASSIGFKWGGSSGGGAADYSPSGYPTGQ